MAGRGSEQSLSFLAVYVGGAGHRYRLLYACDILPQFHRVLRSARAPPESPVPGEPGLASAMGLINPANHPLIVNLGLAGRSPSDRHRSQGSPPPSSPPARPVRNAPMPHAPWHGRAIKTYGPRPYAFPGNGRRPAPPTPPRAPPAGGWAAGGHAVTTRSGGDSFIWPGEGPPVK